MSRAVERDGLEADFSTVLGRTLGVVLLTGEPGVGNPPLVSEVTTAHRPDAVVLTARAYPIGATASLGVWVDTSG